MELRASSFCFVLQEYGKWVTLGFVRPLNDMYARRTSERICSETLQPSFDRRDLKDSCAHDYSKLTERDYSKLAERVHSKLAERDSQHQSEKESHHNAGQLASYSEWCRERVRASKCARRSTLLTDTSNVTSDAPDMMKIV